MQFIFSTAIDGKIKAWLYDLAGSRMDIILQAYGALQWLTSKPGCMILRDLGWTIMLQAYGAPQWLTVLMEPGKMLNLEWCLVCKVPSCGSEFYFLQFLYVLCQDNALSEVYNYLYFLLGSSPVEQVRW